MLAAIGAAPHLTRPNLPAPAPSLSRGREPELVPFGEPALQHFMFLERPEGMALEGGTGIDAHVQEAVPLMAEGGMVPQLQDFATVGHLCARSRKVSGTSPTSSASATYSSGRPRQATSADFRWPELVAVTDLASAQRALDTILEQGEGARGHWEAAHFGEFVQILDEYRQKLAANPAFDPVRPVIFATVRHSEHDDAAPLIGDRVTARCTDLFNVSYEILLQILERYFAHTEETDAQLGTLANAAVALMGGVLGPLGDLITTLPVGPEHPGRTAGPSFELFYEDDDLLPIGNPPGCYSRSACAMRRPSARASCRAHRRASRACSGRSSARSPRSRTRSLGISRIGVRRVASWPARVRQPKSQRRGSR